MPQEKPKQDAPQAAKQDPKNEPAKGEDKPKQDAPQAATAVADPPAERRDPTARRPGQYLVQFMDDEATVSASSPAEAWAKFCDGKRIWPSPKLVFGPEAKRKGSVKRIGPLPQSE